MDYICDIPKKFCNLRKDNGECMLEKPCLPIVEQCEGCEKVENGYCKMYIAPTVKWRVSKICPGATHIKKETKKSDGKKRIGQQKQRRRR